jgi:hypothetical protein
MIWHFCPACGARSLPKDVYCADCSPKNRAAMAYRDDQYARTLATKRARYPKRFPPKHANFVWQAYAMATVNKAKAQGLLPALDGSIACTDCDRAAECYDHRDYSRPLDVEPVCQSCNLLRGTAKWPHPRDYNFKRMPDAATDDQAA